MIDLDRLASVVVCLGLVLISGCYGADDIRTQNNNSEEIISFIDSRNDTSGGFPRQIYSACGTSIVLRRPFRVIQDGWGDAPVAIPLDYLHNRDTAEVAEDGVNASDRVTYHFPSHYRGIGMAQWQSKVRNVYPLTRASEIMQRGDTVRFASIEGVHFRGVIEGHNVSMFCTALEDAVNPTCTTETFLETGTLAVQSKFPPAAIKDLNNIVRIGDDIFAGLAKQCLGK